MLGIRSYLVDKKFSPCDGLKTKIEVSNSKGIWRQNGYQHGKIVNLQRVEVIWSLLIKYNLLSNKGQLLILDFHKY